MKILIYLFIALSSIVSAQTLDLTTFGNLQKDLLRLNGQLKNFVDEDFSQHSEVIANIGITYTLAFSYFEQIIQLAYIQKFYITKDQVKKFNVDKNRYIDGWIKTFKNLEAMFYNRIDVFQNPKFKKNINDAVKVLDRTIDELKKCK